MFGQMTFLLRGPDNPMSLGLVARRAVAEVDPDIPIADFVTMEQLAGGDLPNRRYYMLVFGVFAWQRPCWRPSVFMEWSSMRWPNVRAKSASGWSGRGRARPAADGGRPSAADDRGGPGCRARQFPDAHAVDRVPIVARHTDRSNHVCRGISSAGLRRSARMPLASATRAEGGSCNDSSDRVKECRVRTLACRVETLLTPGRALSSEGVERVSTPARKSAYATSLFGHPERFYANDDILGR